MVLHRKDASNGQVSAKILPKKSNAQVVVGNGLKKKIDVISEGYARVQTTLFKIRDVQVHRKKVRLRWEKGI